MTQTNSNITSSLRSGSTWCIKQYCDRTVNVVDCVSLVAVVSVAAVQRVSEVRFFPRLNFTDH